MFSILPSLLIRHPKVIVLGWLALATVLYFIAPPWEQVTKDDSVRFFPPESRSVVGHDLLESGFPKDALSSGLVLVHERKNQHLTTNDLRYIERVANDLDRFARSNPELGITKLDTHRTPVIGPRLIGTSADGRGQAALTMVSLRGTHLSKKSRIAVDKILEWSKTNRPAPPDGLEFALTGSAVVGHDTNRAAGESIHNTTYTTVALVLLILLLVYRSPLLAMVPLLTIALSVFVSLKMIVLLTTVPGLGFQVINITQGFRGSGPLWRGHRLLPVPDRASSEELARGRSRNDALHESIKQVGAALVASAGTVIVGLGMLYFSSFAKVRYTGPTIALSLTISLIAALTLAPALLAWLGGAIFWPCRAPITVKGADREAESLQASHEGVLGWSRQPGGQAPAADFVCLPDRNRATGRHWWLARSNYTQLADLDPDRVTWSGECGETLFRRWRAEPFDRFN